MKTLTLGVKASSGLGSPIVAVLAFIPIVLTSIGYSEMNKADPDCGTTFTWGARRSARAPGGPAAGRSSPLTC